MFETEMVFSRTQRRFLNDKSKQQLLMGGVGSGKTVTCCWKVMLLAACQQADDDGYRKTKILVFRNTYDQLKKTTRRTFLDWFPSGQWGTWKASDSTYYIDREVDDGTIIKSEIVFLPLDTEVDKERILSLDLTCAYGNEWRELNLGLMDDVRGRLGRYPKEVEASNAFAFYDTNWPDADSPHQEVVENPAGWSVHQQPKPVLTVEEYVEIYGEEPKPILVENKKRRSKFTINEQWPLKNLDGEEYVINPGADNIRNLQSNYYRDNLTHSRKAWCDVFLACKFAPSNKGMPIYKGAFKHSFHVQEAEANTAALSNTPDSAHPIIIGIDGGRSPAVVFVQRDDYGIIRVLSEITVDSQDFVSAQWFVDQKIKPHISRFYNGYNFIMAPDPTLENGNEVVSYTAADVYRNAGFKVVLPASNKPEIRIDGVRTLLNKNVMGRAKLQISPKCRKLISGFNHGYMYEKDQKGNLKDKPLKNDYSHVHDALQYAILVAETAQKGEPYGRAGSAAMPIQQVGWRKQYMRA